jgi:hypothetical protein
VVICLTLFYFNLFRFSIEKYPTSLADVGFGEDGSYSNSSRSYWHTLNARLGGGKNGKILSDLVAVGGKLASDTLVSLYSEVDSLSVVYEIKYRVTYPTVLYESSNSNRRCVQFNFE